MEVIIKYNSNEEKELMKLRSYLWVHWDKEVTIVKSIKR